MNHNNVPLCRNIFFSFSILALQSITTLNTKNTPCKHLFWSRINFLNTLRMFLTIHSWCFILSLKLCRDRSFAKTGFNMPIFWLVAVKMVWGPSSFYLLISCWVAEDLAFRFYLVKSCLLEYCLSWLYECVSQLALHSVCEGNILGCIVWGGWWWWWWM